MNSAEKNKLNVIFNELIGTKLKNMFYQPTRFIIGDNVFVCKFSKHISFHVSCFVRIAHENRIILTSSDEYTSPEYRIIDSGSSDNFIKNTLFEKSLNSTLKLLKNKRVINVEIGEVYDITIEFDNGVNMVVIVDCQREDYEYYRIFKRKRNSIHYVIGFKEKEITFLQ